MDTSPEAVAGPGKTPEGTELSEIKKPTRDVEANGARARVLFVDICDGITLSAEVLGQLGPKMT